MKQRYLKKINGFSLVEMIIYLAFFAILSILAINATILVMKSFYSLRLDENINQSATTAMERMSREIRNAYDVNTVSSILDTSPGMLTLLTRSYGGTNTIIVFYVDASNQPHMSIDGVDNGPLVSKTITVTNLVFHLLTGPKSMAVKIEMTLHDSHSTIAKSIKFYDTIVLRGSIN